MSDNIKYHDLRANPQDLPENGRGVLARTSVGSVFVAVHLTPREGASHWFYVYNEDVIGWCELPACMRDDDERDEGGIDIEAEEDPDAGPAD